MREILFKAKRTDNGEWVMGGTIIQFLDDGVRSFYIPQFNEKCICEHDETTDDILSFSDCRFYKVDPETICRYTGVTDKNGNMIWENDIGHYHGTHDDICVIRYGEYDNNTRSKHIGFYTSWQTYDFMFRQDLGFWTDEREIEIIGNVFDNPELLEE